MPEPLDELYRCGTRGCRGEPDVHHQPLKRWFCQKCWQKHCEETPDDIPNQTSEISERSQVDVPPDGARSGGAKSSP